MNDQEINAWQKECLAKSLIKKMENRGFKATYAASGELAAKEVFGQIDDKALVALLGSQTMSQIGVYGVLRESGRALVDHSTQTKGLSPEEAHQYRCRVFGAEVMLASANALDAEGRIYNIDGLGNRVSAMIYGPKKVILAVSLSKVAPTPEEAWRRARNIAAPMNCKRLGMANPCVKSGHCHDCQLPTSICNYFSVIDRSLPAGRISVVLIGENYGY